MIASLWQIAKLNIFIRCRNASHIRLNPDTPCHLNCRHMTTSKRVKDRSKKKRIHDLEIATEKWKIFSKIHFLMELLRSEPEHVMPIRSLDRYRHQFNLPKPHRVSDFVRKSPLLFELYKDPRGTLWVGMTEKTEQLCEEEDREIEANSGKAAEYVTRLLMMSIDGRLRVDKIAHFRRDFGLPMDFRTSWVHRYPDLFRVVKSAHDEVEYLELVGWKREWAVTELEKKVGLIGNSRDVLNNASDGHRPGMLSLAFPTKFPSNYKRVSQYKEKIENFQRTSYLSPYGDGRGLVAGSAEFDKRGVAIMHEMLSFTLDKRLVTDHLTHFRQEFVMPQKLMRYLLKHIGIFYVSERGKRYHVFLNEAYEGQELVEKRPLVLWKEKVLSLTGYREKKINKKRKKADEVFEEDLSDFDAQELLLDNEEVSEDEILDDGLLADESEMDIEDVSHVYEQ